MNDFEIFASEDCNKDWYFTIDNLQMRLCFWNVFRELMATDSVWYKNAMIWTETYQMNQQNWDKTCVCQGERYFE